ncbi:MAG: AAA family ATPase [Bacteroidales bacterium]|nr:AAA family ATPase [Bacteroidales bacterium]
MYQRIYKIEDEPEESLFLFGARQTGKTTLIRERFPDAVFIDLLKSEIYTRLQKNPERLRQQIEQLPEGSTVVIDEIQQLPELLNEIHWLISNRGIRFVLCGSSARKLKRSGVNTLGGRALPCNLFPLVSQEIENFDINKAVNYGMLPKFYSSSSPKRLIQAYVDVYLKEEIKAEALVRNLTSFAKFLEAAAMTDGEIVNYQNIASDCGVSANTAKEYFNILIDTLIGYMIPPYTKVMKRKMVQASRFYYFDIGITNHLLRRYDLQPGSPEYGHAFEHLVIQEIIAYNGYTHKDFRISYWRTYSGQEVDVILGEADVAIEIKSSDNIENRHLKGLKAFHEEFPTARQIVVSLDLFDRTTDSGIEITNVHNFFKNLWKGNVI